MFLRIDRQTKQRVPGRQKASLVLLPYSGEGKLHHVIRRVEAGEVSSEVKK